MRHRPARLVLPAKREDASSGIHGRSDNEAEAVSAAGEMKLEEVVMTGTKSSWKVTQVRLLHRQLAGFFSSLPRCK